MRVLCFCSRERERERGERGQEKEVIGAVRLKGMGVGREDLMGGERKGTNYKVGEQHWQWQRQRQR